MDAHDLYGLPLDQFVPERTALVKALRAEGQREEATRVSKLAKPSVAAWAVNQLVRTQRRAINELFKAGDQLKQAQEELLAGRGGGQKLRRAGERERQAVDELTRAARGLLTSDGHELSPATLDRVADTLRAAALDDDARAQVKDGALVRELRHVGLGGLDALVAAPSAAGGSAARRGRRSGPKAKAGPEVDRAAAERASRLEAARRAEAEAARAAENAAGALADAEGRRDEAAVVLSEAEETVRAAREQARQAKRAHARARAERERLEE